VCAGLESLPHSIMSTVRLIDDQITALRERPMGGLFSELTHPLKLDTRSRNMAPSPPKVFISYSHDSTEHKALVLRFAQRLRKDGVDAQIDQFVGGRPREGWPRWMLDKLDWAEFVLLICTETYYRRFRGHEAPGTGKGADWEGQLITLELYQAKSRTTKFVPVIFGSRDKEFIPEPLRDHPYQLDSEDSYRELYRFLTGQAGIPLAELGAVKALSRAEVEPLTFGKPDEKAPLTGKIEDVPERSTPHSPREAGQPPLRRKRRQPSRDNAWRRDQWDKVAPYAVISLVSFFCGVGILGLMLWNAQTLVALGLTGDLYYIALLPLGLSAAAFLFGVLQSYAWYRGRHLGGVLELAGPIVGFALVVIGGFFLVPNPTAFALSVYVHGEAGAHDLVPKDSGEVVMELGPDIRHQSIGQNGQAYFTGIPPSFRGQEVPIWVDSKQFESVNPDQKHSLKDTTISLEVRKKAGHISGRVQDANGNPIPGAAIHVAGISKITDSAGHFEFAIPGDRMQTELDLETRAEGYAPVTFNNVVPNANPLTIQLERSR
jgi:hypothetical protein